jgi:hypothetical protein
VSRATETQRHGDEFTERNAWLHLLLGLESWGRRFDAILEEHAPPSPSRVAEVSASEARLIDFVLGLASMRATLRRHLDAAASDAIRAPATERPRRAGGWLR